VQVPWLHVPLAANVSTVVRFLQLGAFCVLHVTPAHGSGLQAPLAQPKEQGTSIEV
jgi:hypothetical protein